MTFDEAQLLRNMMGGKGRIDFRSLLAYAYDKLSNLIFILTVGDIERRSPWRDSTRRRP